MRLETTPLWLIALVMTLVLLAAEELGYRCHSLFGRFTDRDDGKDEAGVGYLLSATLALLGLLIAFTVSMSADRYNARRHLVVAEANAISTAYLRAQLLDEPARGRLSGLFGSYIKAREDFFTAGENKAAIADADARTGTLQARIWAETARAVRAAPAATINPSLLQAMNEAFDIASARRAALDARVPAAILRTLAAYAVVAAALMGYGLARARQRHFVASTTLFVLLALSITLIIDLDQPRSGLVTISQTPMSRTAESIRQMEGAKAVEQPPSDPSPN